jgi:hypothetical protein
LSDVSTDPLDEAAALLQEVIVGLQQIHSTVTVGIAALRQQASGFDEDIASVLSRGAGDRLQDQLEKVEAVLRMLEKPNPDR